MARKAKPRKRPLPKEIAFEFIKSNLFRVIAVEGAFGGIAPHGKAIRMAIYNERKAIPRKTVHSLNEGGDLGSEILEKREERKGYIREIEADLVFDLATAISIRHWLDSRITEWEKLNAQALARQSAGRKPRKKGNGKP